LKQKEATSRLKVLRGCQMFKIAVKLYR